MTVNSVNKSNWLTEIAINHDKNFQQSDETNATNSQPQDSVEISEQGQVIAQAKKIMEEMQNNSQELKRQLENAQEQGEALNEEMMNRLKCLIIAMRIISGDTVPTADHRFLAEKDMGMYSKAIILRTVKQNPHKFKRLSPQEQPDEDTKTVERENTETPQQPEVEIQAVEEMQTEDATQ